MNLQDMIKETATEGGMVMVGCKFWDTRDLNLQEIKLLLEVDLPNMDVSLKGDTIHVKGITTGDSVTLYEEVQNILDSYNFIYQGKMRFYTDLNITEGEGEERS